LLKELDDADFAVRQRAGAALEALGEPVETPLRQALQAQPSLEQRRRIEAVLAAIAENPCPGEVLRKLRVVEVLELIDTKEARELLAVVKKEGGR
jgi:hypothetical protein